MFTFQVALETFSPDDQNAISSRLNTLATKGHRIGRQVYGNIFIESKLSVADATEILQELLASENDVASLKEAYNSACRSHKLQGPEMNGARPGLLGRAVTPKSFYRMLHSLGKFSSVDRARAWVTKILGFRPTEAQTAYWMRKTPLGRNVMWATYNKNVRDENSFEELSGSADEIRDVLGLDPAEKGEPLLLFTYEPSAGLILRFPTVADAEWHFHFRPAPDDPAIEAGLTLPIADEIEGWPEVVHEPVWGNTLKRPIEERF